MANTMIPCTNPLLCGVKNHRPGTGALCKATRNQKPAGSARRGLSAVPAKTAAVRPGSGEPPVFSAEDLQEYSQMSQGVQRQRRRMEGEGAEQIKDWVRENTYLVGEGLEVEVHENAFDQDGSVQVIMSNPRMGSAEPMQFVRHKIFPQKASDGKVTLGEVDRYSRQKGIVADMRTKIMEYATSAVADHLGTGPDEKIDIDNVGMFMGNGPIEGSVGLRGSGRKFSIARDQIFQPE